LVPTRFGLICCALRAVEKSNDRHMDIKSECFILLQVFDFSGFV
jgi:hypothetical protein